MAPYIIDHRFESIQSESMMSIPPSYIYPWLDDAVERFPRRTGLLSADRLGRAVGGAIGALSLWMVLLFVL